MPGTQTKGYDAVIEFSEVAVNKVISTFFDSGGLLSTFLTKVGLGAANGAFSLDVLFDRPADPRVPASASDVLDLIFTIGPNGQYGQLRAVAGLDIDHHNGSVDLDIVRLNFKDTLFFTEVHLGSIPIPGLDGLFAGFLRNTVKAVPLLPMPVNRTTTEAANLPVSADVQVIDTASAGRDALAFPLTFAGGGAGNAAALTNFIDGDQSGAIALFFRWIARILTPKLAGAFGVNASDFTVSDDAIRLNRHIPFQGTELRTLDVQLKDGFIELRADLYKSGFCYEATGSITGRLRLEIVNGALNFSVQVDDPQIDVDIPWYCYLGAAILAAVTGGLAGMLVGGLVGGAAAGGLVGAVFMGILVPVIMAVMENALVPAIQGAAGSLAQQLRQNLSIPAIGLNLVFQKVFIDDVAVQFHVEPIEEVAIRSRGLLVVPNGQCVDLDSGRVGVFRDVPGADLEWAGAGNGRFLRNRCGAALARLGGRSVDSVLRWQLYPLPYADLSIPLQELAIPFPIPFPWFPETMKYLETYQAYGVKTSEGRWAVISVREMFDDHLLLEYKVYEKRLPSLHIRGGFSCSPLHFPVNLGEATEVTQHAPLYAARLLDRGEVALNANVASWTGVMTSRVHPVGEFLAVTGNMTGHVEYRWQVAGEALKAGSGSVKVQGNTVKYQVHGNHLTLTVNSKTGLEFTVAVTALDEAGNSLSAMQCVTYQPWCRRRVPVIPDLDLYVSAYAEHFGVVPVLPAPVASPGVVVISPERHPDPEPVPVTRKPRRQSAQ